MQTDSFQIAIFWGLNALCALIGNMIAFTGFGFAGERLIKRLRDSTFVSLVRQEVAFFDKRRIETLTSQLQNDTALLHHLVGEPIRSFTIALAAVFLGLAISLYVSSPRNFLDFLFHLTLIYVRKFMWPFGLMSLTFLPLVGFARILNARQRFGTDEGCIKSRSGGAILETLGSMKTIFSLTLEEQKLKEFQDFLEEKESDNIRQVLTMGMIEGYQGGIGRWVNAVQFGWGGWLLFRYPSQFQYSDFLNANFSVIFSYFGLGVAFSALGDKKERDLAAKRLFATLDRQSAIDPLSDEGLKWNR